MSEYTGGPNGTSSKKKPPLRKANSTSDSIDLNHVISKINNGQIDGNLQTAAQIWNEAVDDQKLDAMALPSKEDEDLDAIDGSKSMSSAQMAALEHATLKKMNANTKKLESWIKRQDDKEQKHMEERVQLTQEYAQKNDWIEYGIPWLHVPSKHPALQRRLKEELLRHHFGHLIKLAERSKIASEAGNPDGIADDETVSTTELARQARKMPWDNACERSYGEARTGLRKTLKEKPSNTRCAVRWHNVAIAKMLHDDPHCSSALGQGHTSATKSLSPTNSARDSSPEQQHQQDGKSAEESLLGSLAPALEMMCGVELESVPTQDLAEMEVKIAESLLEEHREKMREIRGYRKKFLHIKSLRSIEDQQERDLDEFRKQQKKKHQHEIARNADQLRAWLHAKERGQCTRGVSDVPPPRCASAPLKRGPAHKDSRPLYTGGPGNCWFHGSSAQDRRDAASKIQQSWKNRASARMLNHALAELMEKKRKNDSEHVQAMAKAQAEADAQKAAQKEKQVQLAAQWNLRAGILKPSDDAQLVHYVRTGDDFNILRSEVASRVKPSLQLTALFSAARADQGAVLDALLETGCDCDAADPKTGKTALHIAAEEGATEAIKVLLSRGASTQVEDHRGQKPIDVGSPGVQEILQFADQQKSTQALRKPKTTTFPSQSMKDTASSGSKLMRQNQSGVDSRNKTLLRRKTSKETDEDWTGRQINRRQSSKESDERFDETTLRSRRKTSKETDDSIDDATLKSRRKTSKETDESIDGASLKFRRQSSKEKIV